MLKCDKCLHNRLIIFENGLQPICTLSPKEAKNCILNGCNKLLTLDEWDVLSIEPILEPLIRKEMEDLK